jgi:hypothetical protein
MIKRFLTIQTIKDNLNRGKLLKDLFKADAIIFVDKLSTEVYNLYRGGMTEKQIVEKIKDWNI